MTGLIFDPIQKRRLMNPRESPGKSSKRSLSMGNRHESWLKSFNKRTLGATSLCDFSECNGCLTQNGNNWQCNTGRSVYTIYNCSNTPPANMLCSDII